MRKADFEAVMAEMFADVLAQVAGVVRELGPYAPIMDDLGRGGTRETYPIQGDDEGTVEVRWYPGQLVHVLLKRADWDEPVLVGAVRCNADDLAAASWNAAREIVQAIEGLPEPGAATLRALSRAVHRASEQLQHGEEAWALHQARAARAMREIIARLAPQDEEVR